MIILCNFKLNHIERKRYPKCRIRKHGCDYALPFELNRLAHAGSHIDLQKCNITAAVYTLAFLGRSSTAPATPNAGSLAEHSSSYACVFCFLLCSYRFFRRHHFLKLG